MECANPPGRCSERVFLRSIRLRLLLTSGSISARCFSDTGCCKTKRLKKHSLSGKSNNLPSSTARPTASPSVRIACPDEHCSSLLSSANGFGKSGTSSQRHIVSLKRLFERHEKNSAVGPSPVPASFWYCTSILPLPASTASAFERSLPRSTVSTSRPRSIEPRAMRFSRCERSMRKGAVCARRMIQLVGAPDRLFSDGIGSGGRNTDRPSSFAASCSASTRSATALQLIEFQSGGSRPGTMRACSSIRNISSTIFCPLSPPTAARAGAGSAMP